MIAPWFNAMSTMEDRPAPEYDDRTEGSSGMGDGDPATISERYPLFQARAE